MGIAERRIRQKEEVRTSILNAAWQLVEAEGWQALSIRKIAEAIEYSVPVIYDHFVNKEAIQLEFTKKGFRMLNEYLAEAKSKFSEPDKQIKAIAEAYWKFSFTHREYYQLMFGLGMPTCETVRQIAELNSFSELILDSLRKLIAAGNKKQTDPLLKLHTFWSMLHGHVSISMMGTNESRTELNEMVLRDFIESFISGIRG